MSAINFDRLEKDLESALEADRRYWEKNDAKFRAVNQRVATYDEFKEIVNASHLKPLEKGESVTDMKTGASAWNRASGVGVENSADFQPPDRQSDSETPVSCQQLVRRWRTFKNNEEKYQYLLSLPPTVYASLFASDIPFGLLGDFVRVFDACHKQSDSADVGDILLALTGCGRFRLAVQFFSEIESAAARSLTDKLADQQLKQAFCHQ